MAAGDMIFLFKGVSSGTWTVPTGVTAIKVECFGGAADLTFNSNNSIQAQVGGSYSQTSTLSVIAGNTIYFNVSTAGDTWINKTSNAVPTSTTDGCLAVGANTAAASQVAANVGNIKYAGGDGVGWSTVGSISGRGGQAGPNGAGANSGPVYSNTPAPAFYGSYIIGNGGGANGGVSGGLGSIPYGRSGGAFGGNGGYWDGSNNISATQDILGEAQYLNGYPVTGTLNYGPFGGAQAVYTGTSGSNDSFLISGQQSFIVITVIEATQKSIIFGGTSGSFTLPSDFSSLISLRAWGACGVSAGGDATNGGGGGGGATYSETVAASITATMNAGSTVVYYGSGISSGNTRSYINIGINSNQPLVTTGVLAFNGNNSSSNTGGTASASSNVGTTVRAGGTGGAGYTSTRNNGGGGGGAGGPLGAGAIGGSAAAFLNRGGGGGGASNGGSAGGNATNTLSGAGGSITGGSGGTGATASVAATAGTNGGGSGGGYATTYGDPPKGSILSFENGLYYINGGTGGDGGRSGNNNSGGEGGGPVTISSNGTLYYTGGMVVFTYVPTTPVATSEGNFLMFF
jgi:hypothetical protein